LTPYAAYLRLRLDFRAAALPEDKRSSKAKKNDKIRRNIHDLLEAIFMIYERQSIRRDTNLKLRPIKSIKSVQQRHEVLYKELSC